MHGCLVAAAVGVAMAMAGAVLFDRLAANKTAAK
jgi:hypothetical protein